MNLKFSCYCPFNILSIAKKTPGGKKIYNFKLLHANNLPKIAEVKLSSCGLEVADFIENCDCGIAELRLRSYILQKVADLRLRKCFLQVAELRLRTKKKVARAHLWYIL
jgi:hypothetical protein